jgi:hypothetical protein
MHLLHWKLTLGHGGEGRGTLLDWLSVEKIGILHYIPATEIWTSSRSGRRRSAAAAAVHS